MGSRSDSSSDDDCYVSSAARLKALRKKPIVISDEDSPVAAVPSIQPQRLRHTTRSSIRNAQVTPSPVIVVDDDDANILGSPVETLNDSLDVSVGPDDDNYNMDIKVKWQSIELHRLQLRKYESFQKIFDYFANKKGVSEKQILLLKDDKPIRRTDTPASLDLSVIDFLEGGIVSVDVMAEEQAESAENVCKIKVQMSTKQKIHVDLKMDETFKTVVMTCAEQLGVAPSRIKLSFDGDQIALTDTPESLDLEQDACIDLRVIG